MDYLWSPWRFRYVSTAGDAGRCIFCDKPSLDSDEENLIVYRGRLNYVLLNLFPYTCGHLMVAPYQHVATLSGAGAETLAEMMELVRDSERHIQDAYRPQGINLGMNLGECAGAGVAGHIHMHVVPRWTGDANFMTVVGETRVLPEDLPVTYQKLRSRFSHLR